VVLAMMKVESLSREVRAECVFGVREFGKGKGHGFLASG
jgi:hypothetical protein